MEEGRGSTTWKTHRAAPFAADLGSFAKITKLSKSEAARAEVPTKGMFKSWSPETAARLERAADGRSLHLLQAGDLHRSKELKAELQHLKLSNYFDECGRPRFRRLGVSFAAKQHPDIKELFGSQIENGASARSSREFEFIGTRAAHRASEALERDAISSRGRTRKLLEQMSSMDKHIVEDVRERQLELIFGDMPHFSDYLPPGVQLADLLPAEIRKEVEYKDRRDAQRWNSYFTESGWIEGDKMGWLLPQEHILQLNEALTVWARAARGMNYTLGVDRSTFVRFILDCGLVDQQKVPLFWAVKIFIASHDQCECAQQMQHGQ